MPAGQSGPLERPRHRPKQRHEILWRELLGPCIPSMAQGDQYALCIRASRLGQVVDQTLAAAPEGGEHERFDAPVLDRPRSTALHIQDGGVYPRGWLEDVDRDLVEDPYIRQDL